MSNNLKQLGLAIHNYHDDGSDTFAFTARGDEAASGHSGGVNVLLGDGSVRFLAYGGADDAAEMSDGSVRFVSDSVEPSWTAVILPHLEQDSLL